MGDNGDFCAARFGVSIDGRGPLDSDDLIVKSDKDLSQIRAGGARIFAVRQVIVGVAIGRPGEQDELPKPLRAAVKVFLNLTVALYGIEPGIVVTVNEEADMLLFFVLRFVEQRKIADDLKDLVAKLIRVHLGPVIQRAEFGFVAGIIADRVAIGAELFS